MAREAAVTLRHHRLEARITAGGQAAVGKERQLEPALVEPVDRLVELLWLADVHQHGDAETPGRLEDRVELRIVDRDAPALSVAHVDPEVLEELQADGAGRDVALELRGGARAETGPHATAKLERREEDHAVRIRAVRNGREAALQRPSRPAAQIDQDLEVERIHLLHDGPPARRRKPRPMVAVDVDDRKAGARHRVRLDDQGGTGRVLLDGQSRLVRAPAAPLRLDRRRNEDTREDHGARREKSPPSSVHACAPIPRPVAGCEDSAAVRP